ncbi:hypothetical protein [Spirosoma oryzicola]|uniref:hypothetical protein n=1 Tax=Spirosoma oryzicola TaxID=2898794 RepID=UPI001E292379|nr:hypothetical protein [Spirosoma oryzicola]UHG93354.1 hypothetical protein LQ777_10725 [Spirosoma oryzicola]
MGGLEQFIELVRQTRELEKRFAKKREANLMLKIQQNQNRIDKLLDELPKLAPSQQASILR